MWIPLAMGGGKWFRFNFLVWKLGEKNNSNAFQPQIPGWITYVLGCTEALNDSCSNHRSINGRKENMSL